MTTRGIEARRGETRSGSIHESPVPNGHAPNPVRNPAGQSGAMPALGPSGSALAERK